MNVAQAESLDEKYHFTITESSPSIAVIEAMALVTEQDPLDMEPLADVIDPDALDQLLSRDNTVVLSFRWEGHDVQVFNSGDIIVSGSE